ncbi:MAG: AAA family ATPase [Candidatus Portnoybacteria bacterium]|nr:AAA family ATPase [Candidatus Portnoybacteria bacterium]
MREGFPTIERFEAFKPEDAEKLSEITRIREELLKSEALPKEAKDALSGLKVKEKSKEVFEALETHEQERETIGVNEERKVVRIGREQTPIFEGPTEKLTWQLAAEQFREQGQTMVELSFKRNDGVEVKPGGVAKGKTRLGEYERYIPLDEYRSLKKENPKYLDAVEKMSGGSPTKTSERSLGGQEEERRAAEEYLTKFKQDHPKSEWVLRAMRHLNSLAVHESCETLERDPYFVETPHVVETMEKFTRLVNRQRERGQGIVILEGDAGTGKNKIVDHLGYLTKRPLFRFTCSAGKDEQDLKYLLEYDSKKGTYRIKSTVIEALETPGAILEFDEINTLKPEVAKILNSLFDHDRALFLGEDRTSVKAAEEVVMVGLQNPQHYMGVKPLTETIKSRARIMEVTYPPFEKEKTNPNEPTQYRSDEALIVRQYIPELKDLDQREFQILWDSVVNKREDPRATELLTSARKERIEDVQEVVEMANKIREAYRAYHEGKSDEPIKFVFSLRESVECAFELPHVELTAEEKKKGMTRAKKAVQEVILPKIPLGEERTYLQSLIAEL